MMFAKEKVDNKPALPSAEQFVSFLQSKESKESKESRELIFEKFAFGGEAYIVKIKQPREFSGLLVRIPFISASNVESLARIAEIAHLVNKQKYSAGFIRTIDLSCAAKKDLLNKIQKIEELPDKDSKVEPLIEKHQRIINQIAGSELVFQEKYYNAIEVMEEIKGQDLYQYILTGHIKPHQMIKIFKQINQAVKQLHDIGICHGDLNPKNIIINESGEIFLCDFGKAQKFSQDQMVAPEPGMIAYSSPELLAAYFSMPQPKINGVAADIWSLGSLLYFMLTKAPYPYPFFICEDKNLPKISKEISIKYQEFEKQYKIYGSLDSSSALLAKIFRIKLKIQNIEFENLFLQLFSFDPQKRITTTKILNHPFIKNSSALDADKLFYYFIALGNEGKILRDILRNLEAIHQDKFLSHPDKLNLMKPIKAELDSIMASMADYFYFLPNKKHIDELLDDIQENFKIQAPEKDVEEKFAIQAPEEAAEIQDIKPRSSAPSNYSQSLFGKQAEPAQAEKAAKLISSPDPDADADVDADPDTDFLIKI